MIQGQRARLPSPGKVTKGLCITILAASLIFSVSERRFGFGIQDLSYSVHGVLNGEYWRIFTFPFVEGTTFGLLLGLISFSRARSRTTGV